MRYTIRHIINTDADTFWNKIFFDSEFNKQLFEGHLRFKSYEVLALDEQPDGTIHRRVECIPPVELPAAAKKILGDTTSYVEDGRFDPKAQRFTVDVTPKMGADKVKTRIAIWVEPKADKRIERVVEVENHVKVFGIGGMLEGFIEKQTRANYDAAAEFTNQWIAEKGL